MSNDHDKPLAAPAFTFVFSLVFTLLWALFCNLVLEVLMQLTDPQGMASIFSGGTSLTTFMVGSVLIWSVLAWLIALTGRLWLSAGLLFVATSLLSWANHVKLEHRQEPLYPSDFAFAGQIAFLTDMVGIIGLVLPIGVAVTICVGFAYLGRLSTRRYPPLSRQLSTRGRGVLLGGRVVAILLCSTILVTAANFNSSGNPVRKTYEAAGAHWAWWYQKLNYERNGVIGGFLYNTSVPAMDVPRGYSRETMARIANRYSRLAGAVNHGHQRSLNDTNVVVVLSEAFSDPTRVAGVDFAKDPIPRTRSLMRRTDSGDMLAQLVGGGTANIEFEVLTGLSLGLFVPQMNSPYQMLIPDFESWPSVVGLLKRSGHRAIAVHPYFTKMYQREDVYPVLGFDEFIGEDDMARTQKLEDSKFVSDASAFDEVLRQIDRNTAPLLVNLVTMQNHFPYADAYRRPIRMHGLSDGAKKQAQGFARGLRYSDRALADFLTALEDTDEKTAVIFYGDHLPAFWPNDVVEKNGLLMRRTPYLLWSNFADLTHHKRRLISPTHLIPLLYQDLGVPLPPYYAFLTALRSELPAISQGLLLDDRGQQVAARDLSPRARKLLRDYRLIQYDFSVGQRYAVNRLFPQASDSRVLQAAGGSTE